MKKGRSLLFPKMFIKNKLGDRMIRILLPNLKQNKRKIIQGANIEVFLMILVHELGYIIYLFLDLNELNKVGHSNYMY